MLLAKHAESFKVNIINKIVKMSRMSQSQNSGEIDNDMIKKKALECVEYILFCCLSEKKSIIRKTDLNKNIIKDQSRSFKNIFKYVKQYLQDIFGMDVIELDNDKGEKFGIRSKFEFDSYLEKLTENTYQRGLSDFNKDLTNNESDYKFANQLKYSMLMIALSLIFMNQNEIDSQLFWENLKILDINKEEKRHKYLRDVFKYFTSDLVKDGYLEYEQVPNTDPPAFKFKWGYRARLEISKKSVLNFVCEIYGGLETCKPNEWISQYADAMKIDEFNKNPDQFEPIHIKKELQKSKRNMNDESFMNESQELSSSQRSSQGIRF